MTLDLLLNSPLAVVVLTLICAGLIFYGKSVLLPKIDELNESKLQIKKLQAEKDELLSRLNTRLKDIDESLAAIKNTPAGTSNALTGDLSTKLILMLDKIDKMETIISKHPNNLEISLVDLNRSLMDMSKELNAIVKGYETVSSTLLRQGSTGNDLSSLERLK